MVISLTNDEFTKVEVDGERIVARAGARLKTIVTVAARHQLSGLEFMEGIPGSLGGALRMNAGAMGKQTFDVVEWVRYISYAGDIYDAEAKKSARDVSELPGVSQPHRVVGDPARDEGGAKDDRRAG